MGFIRSPVKGPASAGVAALLRLIGELGSRISEDEYREIFLSLKEAAASLLPGFMKVLRIMDGIEMPESSHPFADADVSSDHGFTNDDLEDDNLQTAAYVVSRVKSHIAVQLLIVQVFPLTLTFTQKRQVHVCKLSRAVTGNLSMKEYFVEVLQDRKYESF
jgi:brefeldin A-inhibited guanine nucleotide-exchange protein